MNLNSYPTTSKLPASMRAPVTPAELLQLMEIARVAGVILALHDDATFICGLDDEANVSKCLADLRSALANFGK